MTCSHDCIGFLVEFFKNNPQVIAGIFHTSDAQQLQALVTNPTQWSLYRDPHSNVDWYEFPLNGAIGVFDPGKTPNKFGEPTGEVPLGTVNRVYEFYCGTDTDIGFVVLEMKDGSLRLGPHCDDFCE